MRFPTYEQMEKLLQQPVRRITEYRRNWLVQTNQQTWVAKRMQSSTKLRWLLSIDSELRSRGFTAMPPIRSDLKHWILTPWIEGKTCQYTNLHEVKKVIRVLATFHRTGRHLQTPPIKGAAFLLTHRLYDRLVQFYQILKERDTIPGEVGELLRTYGSEFYQHGLNVWEKLQSLPLDELNWREYQWHFLAHRDLASHNWLIDQAGKVWLIDFETADYDCQLSDVWQITTRILSSNGWNAQVCKQIFSTYEAIRPLNSLEKTIIYILFSFPNEFFRECIGIIKKKRGYRPENTLPYLKRIIQDQANWREFLKQLPTW
ncbi:phosphotransferase [Thermoflavimicrobium dichotomicum]|uniref:Spore coat protein, CotS family n=1 Tax=Thermoflavimicrobium dichotomicum TaxID=46223 RepID=A0A1I3R889_9BACL|nr:phosphotransferase [Thermoflavimicrobium dichotomicum]SFJ41446.1 spore coat protein, CotS family [Thermoflavimicrobium dichotomicum]